MKPSPFRPDPRQGEKINLNFTFKLLCSISKGFIKAFIKPFDAPKRSVKIKIQVTFHLDPFVPNTPFLPSENIRKPNGFLMFSGGRERAHWEQMG